MSHYCEMFYEIFKDEFLSGCESGICCGKCKIIKYVDEILDIMSCAWDARQTWLNFKV